MAVIEALQVVAKISDSARKRRIILTGLVGMAACLPGSAQVNAQMDPHVPFLLESMNSMSRLKPALETLYLTHGKYPSSNEEAQIGSPDRFKSDKLQSIEVGAGGMLTATAADNSANAGLWVRIVPTAVRGAVQASWRCESNLSEIARYMPQCSYVTATASTPNSTPATASTSTATPVITPTPVSTEIASTSKQSGILACTTLKQEIEGKLAMHGVKHYTLDVIDAGKAAPGKIVGHCDGGTHEIRYLRQ